MDNPASEADKHSAWVRTQAPVLRPTDRGGAARVEKGQRIVRGPGLGKLPLSLPMREGWLVKQGFKNKTWRRRYFRTRINALFYFESPESPKPIGVIPLLDVNFAVNAARPSQFNITHPQRRTFFLEASSAEEAQQWLQTLFTISWNEGGAPWDLTDVPASASVASSTPVPYSFLASLPHCQLSGWLQKNKIGADTGWKRRWFILKENLLFYCKDASDIEPLGAFDLEGCELRVATRSQAIELFHRTRWSVTLLAEAPAQRELWVNVLEWLLKRINGTIELTKPPPAGLERRITLSKPEDMFPEFPPHSHTTRTTPPQSPRSPPSRRERILRILQEEEEGVERLQTLDCRDTEMDASEVVLLARATSLTSLSLCGLPVPPTSVVAALTPLTNLTKLDLSSTPMNDEGIAQLACHLRKLGTLDLTSTLVTDQGVSTLTSLVSLKALNLQATAVSARGCRALLQAEIARLACWQREGYLDHREHGLLRDAWRKMWCTIVIQPQPVLLCKKDEKEALRVLLRPACAMAMADDLHPGGFVVVDCGAKEAKDGKAAGKAQQLFQAADSADMQRWVAAINAIAEYEWLVLYQDECAEPRVVTA